MQSKEVTEYVEAAEREAELKVIERRKRMGRELGVDPGIEPTMLSPTTIGYTSECLYKYLMHTLKIRRRKKAVALGFGSAVDAAFNTLMRNGCEEAPAVKVFKESWEKQREKVVYGDGPKAWTPQDFEVAGVGIVSRLSRYCKSMKPVAVQHWLQRTAIVEPESGAKLDGFVLGGKLDLVDDVDVPGIQGLVVTDLKTVGRMTKPEDQLLHTRLSLQLLVYAYCAKQDSELAGSKPIGAIVSYLEAAKLKTAPKTGLGVQRMYADLPQELFTELFYRCKQTAQTILDARAARLQGAPLEVAYPRNLAACEGVYGPCDFLELCRRSLFKKPPELDETFGVALPWD